MTENPASVVTLHNQAVLDYRAGEVDKALASLARCLELGSAVSGKALAAIHYQVLDFRQAFDVAKQVIEIAPNDFAYQNEFYQEILTYALAQRPRYERAREPESAPPVSFVICSHRDSHYQRVHAQIAQAMQGCAHEVIRVPDASSMNEGYARGLRLCQHQHVVLCHDDIEIFIADFVARLSSAFEAYDMFGIAGSRRMSGPAMLFDGHPHLMGRVYHPARTEAEQANIVICGTSKRVSRAQVIDGVFIAAHRGILETLGFDQDYTGFHYYDVDLSYRARLAGVNIGIATDLGLRHHSTGSFNEGWNAAKAIFERKFPDLRGVPGEHAHWYSMAVPRELDLLTVQQAINFALD